MKNATHRRVLAHTPTRKGDHVVRFLSRSLAVWKIERRHMSTVEISCVSHAAKGEHKNKNEKLGGVCGEALRVPKDRGFWSGRVFLI